MFRSGLDLLYFSGASRALAGSCGGLGAIFMLHHVRPAVSTRSGFAPNAGLEVTAEFLDATIAHVRARGYDIVSLDEAVERIVDGDKNGRAPFVAFTLDDGYADNRRHAWPVFTRHRCPFTIFVAPAIADGVCELWWRALEEVIAAHDRVEADIGGETWRLDTATTALKQEAFRRLYWPVRQMAEADQRVWIRRFADAHGFDLDGYCRSQAMTWDELRDIATDELCTIGAHTINHFALAKLDDRQALDELVGSRRRIGEELGSEPDLFAYPYGDAGSAGERDFALARKAGYRAAVTTRKGLLRGEHANRLWSLPRVSLNGGYQKVRYVDVLLSGAAFALWGKIRRREVA